MWQYQYYDGVPEYSDELKHYGVLGMKWGIRKARKKGVDYAYKSSNTKRYEKKADKYEKKGNTAKAELNKNRAKRSAELDSKMQDSVAKSSAGKTTAKILLNGVFGAKTYEALKASGYNRADSFIATQIVSYMGGPLGAMAVTDLTRYQYVRQDEKSERRYING